MLTTTLRTTLRTPAGRTEQLIEHVCGGTQAIDTTAGIIRGCKILGRFSKNGREYSPNALREAALLYEGIGVNLSHPGKGGAGMDVNGNPPVERGIGWLRNCRVKNDGVYADFHYLKSHPYASVIVESAQRNPRRFGFSHNASGNTATVGGKVVVESMDRVKSVDLVQNPATTSGFFESEGAGAASAGSEISDAVLDAFYDDSLSKSGMLAKIGKLWEANADLTAAEERLADITGTPEMAAVDDEPMASDEIDNKVPTAESWIDSMAGRRSAAALTESTEAPAMPSALIDGLLGRRTSKPGSESLLKALKGR